MASVPHSSVSESCDIGISVIRLPLVQRSHHTGAGLFRSWQAGERRLSFRRLRREDILKR